MRILKLKYAFVALMICGLAYASNAKAATKEDLDKDAKIAFDKLIASNPAAAAISKKSKAVLIFPNIIKAGLVFGGAYGEGVLVQNNAYVSYYNSVTASWGLQAGAQTYGYAVFLMNDNALKYLNDSKGWEVGVGPSVAIVDDGVAKNISSTTLKNDAYAFIFDQQGLMASLSLEGTKITQIKTK